MPASRARTAICSAPLEWPSSPGLPTRILTRRPSPSDTRSTRSRSAASESSEGAAAASPTPVGARYSPNTVAQGRRPLARGRSRPRGGQRRRHDVLVGARPPNGEHPRRPRRRPGRAPARQAGEGLDRASAPRLGSTRRIPPSSPSCSGEGSASVNTFLPTTGQLARLDPAHALAVRLDHLRLHVGHGRHRAAALGHDRHLLRAPAISSATSPSITLRALEDVGVVEQVGLVGQDLLDAQRPLLIPGPRQPERLVPGRQLQRARASGAAHRHAQRLEHDPDDVVLRLRLGQPQRVDLHAVAEAQDSARRRRRSASRPISSQSWPIARSLACSSTKRMPALTKNDMRPNTRGNDLGGHPLAHPVEHRLRGGQRVGDLLHRRRPGLLQVVRADVDRVPLAAPRRR